MVASGGDLAHLANDEVRQIARLPVEERVPFIHRDVWYNFDMCADVITSLKDLMLYGTGRVRPPCMRIVAYTGMAKTTILTQFSDLHPARQHSKLARTVRDVVMVELPPDPNVGSVALALLDQLGVNHRNLPQRRLLNLVLDILRHLQIKILIVDELQRIATVSFETATKIVEIIKYISNNLRIPAVVAGDDTMTRIFLADEQLRNRFEPYEIGRWQNTVELQKVVSTILSYIPTREPPDDAIFTFEGGEMLLATADNTTDKLVTFLKQRSLAVLLAGREKLMFADLKGER